MNYGVFLVNYFKYCDIYYKIVWTSAIHLLTTYTYLLYWKILSYSKIMTHCINFSSKINLELIKVFMDFSFIEIQNRIYKTYGHSLMTSKIFLLVIIYNVKIIITDTGFLALSQNIY